MKIFHFEIVTDKQRREWERGFNEQFRQRCETAQKISDQIIQSERDKVTALQKELIALKEVNRKTAIKLQNDQIPLLLDTSHLLTSVETLGMMRLAHSEDYQYLRSYHLKTAIELYERASQTSQTDSNLLCQFAKYVKSLVAEMDKMKELPPEEDVNHDPYAQ